MGTEIERKFLVDHDQWERLEKPTGIHYRQGYLADGSKLTLRVRAAGQKGFITIKGESKGISRKEYEYEIPLTEAQELIDQFAASDVEKIRHRITVAGKLWEVDEFLGGNSGLILAEIELDDEGEEFEKPGWATKEVSDDVRYYNSYLAKHPFSEW